MNKKYNHVEAFCLMNYRCKKCGNSELIWNSRDGVTPFIIGCNICDGEAMHTRWHLDKRVENYKLINGQKYFRDMTKDELKSSISKRINGLDGTEWEVPQEEKLEVIEQILESEWQEGLPCVRVYKE